jgi:Nuclease-related domain
MNLVFTRRRPEPDPARPAHPGVERARQSLTRQVADLGPTWHALRDVAIGTHGASIDHLVIGPGGMFVVLVRHHPRLRVRVHEQIVFVNDFPAPHLAHAAYEGQRVGRLLGRALGARLNVEPVIAFADTTVDMIGRPRDVHVLGVRRFGAFLGARPRVIEPDVAAWVAHVARDPDTWHDDT